MDSAASPLSPSDVIEIDTSSPSEGTARPPLEVSLSDPGKGPFLRFPEWGCLSVRVRSTDYLVKVQAGAGLDEESDQFLFPEEDGTLLLPAGRKIVLAKTGDPDLYFIPGTYFFQVARVQDPKEVTKEFYFTVYSTGEEEKEIDQLYERLEAAFPGITYNLDRRLSPYAESLLSEEASWAEMLSLVEVQSDAFRKSLRLLPESTSSLLRTLVRSQTGKESARSIRREIQEGWEEVSYRMKPSLSEDSEENRFRKALLLRIRVSFRQILADLRKKKEEKEEGLRLLDAKEREEGLYNPNDRKFLESKRESLSRSVRQIEGYLGKDGFLAQDLAALEKTLSLPLWRNVSPSLSFVPEPSFLQDEENRCLYRFYQIFARRAGLRNPFDRQRTSLLFELYGILILDAALRKDGYRPKERRTAFDFEAGAVFPYEKDGFQAEVLYNHLALYFRESGDEEVVRLNSVHCSPDYLVKIERSSDRTLVGLLSYDMKYQVSGKKRPEVRKKQEGVLIDYLQLAYKRQGKILRGSLDGSYAIDLAGKGDKEQSRLDPELPIGWLSYDLARPPEESFVTKQIAGQIQAVERKE